LDTPADDRRPDDALIALINQGDLDAFTALYERHKEWVVQLATRIAGNPDLALDVLQETFLYVLRKFSGFKLTCQFRRFLYPTVRNLGIAVRKKAARFHQSPETNLDQFEAAPDSVDQAGGRTQLAGVLAELPEGQREVLLMRFVDGLSLDEIAAALDIPTGTVKSRLHNSLASLRRDERTREFF